GFVSVAYAKGTFVATGRSLIATSPDGVAWTKRTANYKYINTRTEVRFLNGRFVAYGQSGTLKSSPDGVSWTDHTPGSTGEISAIAYNGERALLFRGSTPAISAVWPLTDTPSEPPAPTDPGPGNPDEPSNPGNPSNPGDPSNPTPQNPSDPSDAKLVNMSTRAFVGTGSNVLVSGFYIDGTAPKKILVRGVGPTLAQFGLSGVVADPQLKVYDSAGQEIASNDNWSAQANAAEVAQASATAGAFALGNGSADAALVTTLAPGAYSAIISGVNSTTGIAIVEVYDLQPGNGSRLANLSSRTFVGTGAQVSIAGFYVAGTQPKTYLIRGIGPALTNFGVSGALPNPSINVVKSSGEPVTSNDNWGSFSDQAKLAAASASAGAFGLPAGSLDAALVVTLNPGAYSVLVDDTSGATGVSLVELYELK
ncbi:MAG TPA: hypothetical protein VHF69_14340, partial [Candidatus Synoicihabitans sp.]|nr:hypothetical protein [Candidatus Synoicihabitans sp.]